MMDLEVIRQAVKECFPEIQKGISNAVIDGLISGLKESNRESISIKELELFRDSLNEKQKTEKVE